MNNERITNEDTVMVIKTRALRFNIKNYFRAFGETPVGREFPLPTIGRYVAGNMVDLGKGKIIKINEIDEELTPGKKVIIYKKCITK